MNSSDAPHRRQFVRTALATAASYGQILGANDRIRIGAIGTGGRGQYLLSQLKLAEQNEIVACCDVYEPRRVEAKSKYGTADASDHLDYREILDRKDIDAVVIGTPDHWHVPITIAAVRAGKDVYCEKPATHSMEEGAPLLAAVRDSKRVVQIGLQQRSWEHFAQARQEILDGRLGQVTLIRTYWFQNHIPSMAGFLRSTCRSSIGNASWDRRPIVRSIPISSATGAGIGISAAAR
jgi:predicted dehydrogenase